MTSNVTFKGFNTIGQQKKFSLTEFELVKRDILNSFLVRAGEVPGRPGYGSTIYNIIFENMTAEVVASVEAEIRRIIGQEPRVRLINLELFISDHTIIAEIRVETLPDLTAENLFLSFNTDTQSIAFI